jgi:hypothetical protein
VNPQKAIITILATLAVSIALADDFKTIDGKEYKNVTVSRVEPDGVIVKTKSGISKVYFTELPKEVQQRFNYVQPHNAASNQVAATAATGEEGAATLAKAEEQFEMAEMRAAHAYEASEKGTLSGQIFVVTEGRENVKLGAAQVSVFARDAIDDLMAALNTFVAAKSAQLRLDIAAATAAEEETRSAAEQAEATAKRNEEGYKRGGIADGGTAVSVARGDAARAKEAHNVARKQLESLLAKLAYYHSYPFYFGHLRSAIVSTETDGEGKFTIQLPLKGEFAIAAREQRRTVKETEKYCWLLPVSLDGQQQRVQNLTNSNIMVIPSAD